MWCFTCEMTQVFFVFFLDEVWTASPQQHSISGEMTVKADLGWLGQQPCSN